MEHKQSNLDELQDMFEKEINPEELNEIMGAIMDKKDILSDDDEEINNIQLEEDIYQQKNLIKILMCYY